MADDGGSVAKKPRLLGAPPFSGTSLELASRFMVAKELGKASIVCKTWRDDLKPPARKSEGEEDSNNEEEAGVVDNSEAVWKQAATNTNPNVMKAILKNTGSEEKIDFHTLATGLSRSGASPMPELPKPTFRIEDLIVVVELKQKVTITNSSGERSTEFKSLGAFACDESSPMLNNDLVRGIDQDGPFFKIPNKLCPDTYDSNLEWHSVWSNFQANMKTEIENGDQGSWDNSTSPVRRAAWHGCSSLAASVALFRRDTWRSIQLFDNVSVDDGLTLDGTGTVYSCSECHCAQLPVAQNARGAVAHQLLDGHCYARTDISVQYTARLPSSGSEDEPGWLRKMRSGSPAVANWTNQDLEEITKIRDFEFCIESIGLDLLNTFLNGVYEDEVEFTDAEMLLILEGLDWK